MKYLNIIFFVLFSILFINISNARKSDLDKNKKIELSDAQIIDITDEEYDAFIKDVEDSEEDITDFLIRKTKYGLVEGINKSMENGDDVLIWYGVPYGKAPVGKLRWASPKDPKPWKDTLNCTVQAEMALQMSSDKVVGTEDCLNLDIYSPPNAKKLPVMVYIHGGNNQTGDTKELIGNEIVLRNDCIFISINYRLGIFGFNSLPSLHTKSGSTGNYALLDMAKALDWIKENIEEFGGDPNNITITGFSAGGRDVMAMLISPLFSKKFHKAIVFSGGMTIANMEDSIKRTASALAPLAVEDHMAENEEKAKAWLMTDSKKVKNWLYSVSSERLCKLMGNAGIRMSVFPHLFNDGIVLPKEGFSTSKWNHVPVIMLTGSTEFSFFNLGSWTMPEAETLEEKDLQAAKDFGNIYGSDMYRIFNAQISAEKMYKKYKSKIYICQVEFGSDNSAYKIPGVGSFHGIFIPMLSSVHNYIGMYDFSQPAYQAMGDVFNHQLKNFLKKGNPNGKNLPQWKAWTPKKPVSMVLDAADGKASAKCKDVTTTYDDIIDRMEKDTSVSEKGKTLAITKVLNGRWFSDPIDEHFKTPSLWN